MEFEEQPIIFKVIYGGGIGRRWSGKVSYRESGAEGQRQVKLCKVQILIRRLCALVVK